MFKFRHRVLPALFTTAALLFGGGASVAAETELTVAVPHPSAITWAPLWTAVGEGYFVDEGLDLQIQAVDGSGQVLQAMAAGKAQFGIPGPGPLLGARSRGIDVKFIYNLYPKSIFGLLVKEGSGFNEVSDLKGQVIGVGTADGAEVAFARAILDSSGLTEGSDFTFLPVGDGGTAAVAFLRDEVAAYAGAASDAAILAYRGLKLNEITPQKYLGYFGNGLAVMSEYAAENPDVVTKFGRAMVKGMRFLSEPANRETVLAHMASGNPTEGEDRAFAAALLDAILNRVTPTDEFSALGFGYQPPEHWEAWQQSLLDSGDLETPLDDLAAAYSNEWIDEWNQE